MKTVIIDNYDSFTYNLAHLVKELGAETDVLRNDKFRLEELEPYDKIILSPGPGVPEAILPLMSSRRCGRFPKSSVSSSRARRGGSNWPSSARSGRISSVRVTV